MTEWQGFIGKSMVQRDVLTPGLAQRHAATLDLPLVDGAALPGIHWCLCLPEAATAELGPDGHPRRDIQGSFLPPIPLPRRMWASSSVEFLAPIPVGADVERASTIVSITEKSGGSGPLVFVTVGHVTRTGGVEAVREVQNIVYREAAASGVASDRQAPPPARVESHVPLNALKGKGEEGAIDPAIWPHQHRIVPTEPLLLRYSALTFNTHRIHYDLPYAREVEGYAGLVVHGPLMATLLLNHAQTVAGRPLRRFGFRGATPALCGAPLTLAARAEGDGLTLAVLNNAGATVQSGGAD